MHKDKKCLRCGGLDEFIYEMGGVAYFYCGDCNTESKLTHEFYGPEQRMADEAGQ